MSNFATEQMLLAVQTTKESAKTAEREYDRRADALQEKASRNINLFGGTAVSQVADLASDSRKICDALYASYQTLVKMLDSQCRPLLDQEPEIPAVRAVRDLIKWLNDESEIENNFTASLNAHNLGDVASVRYIPGIDNKMIQSFWDSTYHAIPGRADFERREKEEADRKKQAAADIRKAQYEESVKKTNSAKEQYLIDLEDWKVAVAEAERQRSTMLNNLAAQEKNRLEDLANEKYNSTVAEIEVEKTSIRSALGEAQSALSSLGFFQMGEKSRQKKRIDELNLKLSEAEKKLNTAKTTKDQEVRAITSKIAQKKAEWQIAAEEAYPIPEEPCPPGMTPQMFVSKKLQDALYETLRQYDMLTAEELFEKCAAAHNTSIARVNAMLRQMAGDRVYQLERARRMYYQAKPEKDPAEIAKENEKYKEAILNYLKSNGRCTVGDISNNCIDVMSLPIQKVSALTSQLYSEGKIHRTEDGRKAYFEAI